MKLNGWVLLTLGGAFACGTGPDGAGYEPADQALPWGDAQDPPNNALDQSGSDYQTPALDPQRIAPRDEQSLPSSGSAGGTYTGASCGQLCATLQQRQCGDGCVEVCQAWQAAPVHCMTAFGRMVACIGAAGGSCEDAAVGCALGVAVEVQDCPDLFEDEDEDDE